MKANAVLLAVALAALVGAVFYRRGRAQGASSAAASAYADDLAARSMVPVTLDMSLITRPDIRL